MTVALWLMAAQGLIGAFDTIYYHEWRAQLPARGQQAAAELKLHAARDFLYAILFATLPWIAWHGAWLLLLIAVVVAEIVLTLWDFVVEIRVRRALGDVYAGERVTHAIMGIIYGSMLANLIPSFLAWWKQPAALQFNPAPVPEFLRWALLLMAAGVFVSGVRDLYAAFGLPYGGWPWKTTRASQMRAGT